MPTRGKKDPNGRALRGRRAYTTFISDPISQIWSNYNVRSGAAGAATPEQPAVQNCLYDRFEALYKKSSIKPSLVIVPARFKSGTLYSEIPTSGAGDFTVTRATAATRVNASGYIESVASGIPRLDYFASGGTVGCPALLVEPSGSNLIQRSEEFNDSYWGKVSGGTASVPVVTPNVELAPDGTNNADRVVFALNGGTSSTDLSSINSATLSHSAASFTSSVYIRTTDGSTVTMTFVNADGTSTNKTITPTYQRITHTSTGAGTAQYRIRLRGGVTSDSASVAIWGAQYEAGSVATSYIPTTTGSVTRNADVISVSGAVSGSIGQASGTIYAEVDIRNAFAGTFISLDIGSGADFLIIGRTSGLAVIVQLRRSNGSVVTIITSSAVALGVHKIALGYTNGDYALYIDGVSAGTSTNSTDYPSAALTRCGLAVTSYNIFNDRIRAVALYTTRLTNEQLAFITQP